MPITKQTGPVFTLWHGGPSYATPELDQLEEFPTIEDAAIEAENRLTHGGDNAFHYVATGLVTYARTPVVDETSTVQVFLAQPHPGDDLTPDATLIWSPIDHAFELEDDARATCGCPALDLHTNACPNSPDVCADCCPCHGDD